MFNFTGIHIDLYLNTVLICINSSSKYISNFLVISTIEDFIVLYKVKRIISKKYYILPRKVIVITHLPGILLF